MENLIFQVLILVLYIVISNLINIEGGENNIFNVKDYGAVGDGTTENFDAFLNAFRDLCEAKNKDGQNVPTLIMPEGSFILKPLKFRGPCKSKALHIKVIGNNVAPISGKWPNCDTHCWLVFDNINGLTLDGYGSFDGQGSTWWTSQEIMSECMRPQALEFQGCDNLEISEITLINSPKAHMGLKSCSNVSIFNIKISAPENSPNTDGIDLTGSTNVAIFNSTIGSGDDCIAINGGCSKINVTRITCGPGHGISIGNLGDNGYEDKVEEVRVSNCTFIKTENGVRIKTWPGGSGYAKKISIREIILDECKNPIIIDQHYCNGHRCAENDVAVEVNEIIYIGVEGTSASKQAITLDCDKIGCGNITMDNINLISAYPKKEIHSFCKNVNGTSTSTTPIVPCLSSYM